MTRAHPATTANPIDPNPDFCWRCDARVACDDLGPVRAVPGGADVRYGSATKHRREMRTKPPTARRRCRCCGKRATHFGTANGVVLMGGCEWLVRRWVRDHTASASDTETP